MKISPINNQNKAQNPSFNAINQKYYEWGKKYIEKFREMDSEILVQMQYDVLSFKTLSSQDGIDTLKALRELLKPQKDNWLNELIGEFKQLAKQERIAARRAMKKIK